MAHWFGLHPTDIDTMTFGELQEFTSRLAKLPPVGAVYMVSPKEK